MTDKTNYVYNELKLEQMRRRGAQEQFAHTFRPEWQRKIERASSRMFRICLSLIGRLMTAIGQQLKNQAAQLQETTPTTELQHPGPLAD